ncbi:helix-turn-helix domain-containing protein [Mycobacterium sp.]|uniref:helix-turn-helix domain-containing protein n=1 Tax=Mycobacterium sp. TaxID=1785 RepID=UPI00345B9C48
MKLPRWVTIKQAAEYYQVSPTLIRRMIAHEQLDARRIGRSRNSASMGNHCCGSAAPVPPRSKSGGAG